MFPVVVASGKPTCGRNRQLLVACEPVLHCVIEELFRPDKAGIALAADQFLFFGNAPWNDALIEFVGLPDASLHGLVEFLQRGKPIGLIDGVEAATNCD